VGAVEVRLPDQKNLGGTSLRRPLPTIVVFRKAMLEFLMKLLWGITNQRPDSPPLPISISELLPQTKKRDSHVPKGRVTYHKVGTRIST
jgi:hypothetical protein